MNTLRKMAVVTTLTGSLIAGGTGVASAGSMWAAPAPEVQTLAGSAWASFTSLPIQVEARPGYGKCQTNTGFWCKPRKFPNVSGWWASLWN